MSLSAKQKIAFDQLLYQYMDCGDSPERIETWDEEDLEYLAELIRLELASRSGHVYGQYRQYAWCQGCKCPKCQAQTRRLVEAQRAAVNGSAAK